MERIRLASSIDVKIMPRLEVLYYFVYELAESFGVEEDVLDSIKSSRLRPLNLSPSQIRTCGFPAYGSS